MRNRFRRSFGFICVTGLLAPDVLGSAQVDGPNSYSAFEIHQVATAAAESQTFTWEDVPDHVPSSLNLKREAAADASILTGARAVPVNAGPYAGSWDIEVFFTPAGGQAFDTLCRGNRGKQIAYVVCGRAIVLVRILSSSPEPYAWPGRRLGAFLGKEEAERFVGEINDEISRRGVSFDQSVVAPEGQAQ